ncbi:MAG: inositol monophosphatase [Desulfuromonadales bacterium]|nr:inositol monophosphatase [Desulfuromonadales bacterium]
MENFLKIAISAAEKAGEIQRSKVYGNVGISFKGENNLVTEVDKESEKLIVGIIKEAFPDHDILAEENSYNFLGSRYKWIIDPLDGTTNFAHGFPWFAVSIALEMDKEVVLGVVYHSMMKEMFTAIKGKGAYCNGNKIKVSDHTPLKSSLLATGFPYDRTWKNENNFKNFLNFQMAARGVRRTGSAALDLACVAAGRLDGYWECKLNPWDVAAGKLLIEEAGGNVTDYSGKPYSIYDNHILVSNGIIHKEMLEILANQE